MQLVRYLFSYSIVVVVVVLIASGYYYRETLFPNLFSQVGEMATSETTADKSMADSQQKPDHTEAMPAATIPAPAASITEPAAITEPVVTPETIAPAEPITTTEPVSSAEPAVTPEPITPAEPIITSKPVTSAEPAVTPQPAAPAEPIITTESVSSAPPAVTPEPVVPKPIVTTEPVASTAPEVTPVPVAPPVSPAKQTAVTSQSDHKTSMMAAGEAAKSSMPAHEQAGLVSPAPVVQMPGTEAGSIPLSEQQLQEQTERRDIEAIMTARRAYWAGDYDASEQTYQQLIDRYPNEIELQGELGNVFYAQGKWARAAAAYAQVVRQLYGTGQTAQADYMLEIVTSLDKDLGERLQQERMGTSRPQ